MVPRSQKPYFGPLPAPGLLPVQGTPDQWVNGFSYAEYIAGAYPVGTRCVTVPFAVVVGRIRQGQAVAEAVVPRVFVEQAQAVEEATVPFSYVEQAQAVEGDGQLELGYVEQAQAVEASSTGIVEYVEQAQAVEGEGYLDIEYIEQAQAVEGVASAFGDVEQAQAVEEITPEPGVDCDSAGEIAPGETVTETARPPGFDWWKIPFSGGTSWHIDADIEVGKMNMAVYEGTCLSLNQLAFIGGDGCTNLTTSTSSGTLYVRVQITYLFGTDYEFTVDSGTC